MLRLWCEHQYRFKRVCHSFVFWPQQIYALSFSSTPPQLNKGDIKILVQIEWQGLPYLIIFQLKGTFNSSYFSIVRVKGLSGERFQDRISLRNQIEREDSLRTTL